MPSNGDFKVAPTSETTIRTIRGVVGMCVTREIQEHRRYGTSSFRVRVPVVQIRNYLERSEKSVLVFDQTGPIVRQFTRASCFF